MTQTRHDEILYKLGKIEGKLDGILDEAKKTNGRVTKLEEKASLLLVSDGKQNVKLGFIGTVAGSISGLLFNFLMK